MHCGKLPTNMMTPSDDSTISTLDIRYSCGGLITNLTKVHFLQNEQNFPLQVINLPENESKLFGFNSTF